MKKNYYLTLIAFVIALNSYGVQPTKQVQLLRGKQTKSDVIKQKISHVTSTVLITEDFSKFAAGTENVPDAVDVTDEITGIIPSTFTQLAGWSGWGVQQAGGKAYIGWVKYSDYSENPDGPGYLVTPGFDATPATSGYTIKLKARSKAVDGDSLFVYSNYGDQDYDEHILKVSNQWSEYTITATNGDANSYVDIYAAKSEFYIDDIEISYTGGSTGGGSVVFSETFGDSAPTANPRAMISQYTDYDNGAPVAFSVSTTDLPDLRATSSINSHVWFPAAKTTDLVISNINGTGYTDLKLSFEIASNASATNLVNANLNKVNVEVNDLPIQVPNVAFTAQNAYSKSGEISINAANSIKLRFLYTATNNPTNYGYRLDNIKITGTPSTGISSTSFEKLTVWTENDNLHFYAPVNQNVNIFNSTGQQIFAGKTIEGKNQIALAHKGIVIVKVGNRIGKATL